MNEQKFEVAGNCGVERKIPDPAVYATWVKRALADLDMRPSAFLRDEGKPGSANRVAMILRNPHSVKFQTIARLEAEIIEAAKSQGKELLPLLPTAYPRAEQVQEND